MRTWRELAGSAAVLLTVAVVARAETCTLEMKRLSAPAAADPEVDAIYRAAYSQGFYRQAAGSSASSPVSTVKTLINMSGPFSSACLVIAKTRIR